MKTPAQHQREFMNSLKQAIIDAGGVPTRLTRPDTTLADLCSTLAQNGVRFVHEPLATPAEEAGWGVGDPGVVIRGFDGQDGNRDVGTLVVLAEDDGSPFPFWEVPSTGDLRCFGLYRVDRLVPASECKE